MKSKIKRNLVIGDIYLLLYLKLKVNNNIKTSFMRSVIFTIVLLSLFSCHKKNESIVIDLNRNDKVSIFDLVDSISVIKLETRPECLIKSMDQIISNNNRFYIYDRTLYSVFCFDDSGRFLFKINKQGRGPDEYVNCGFINIDKFNDMIMMLVPWGSILYFDLDGNFISKVRLPEEIIAYNEVYSINKDVLLFLSINEYRAAYYSRSGNKLLKRFLKVTPEQRTLFPPIRKTYNFDGSIYFRDEANNKSVINLSDTTNPIKYSFNFGENNNTYDRLMEFESYQKEQYRQGKGVDYKEVFTNKKYFNYYPGASFESKKFRGMSLIYEGSSKYVFYNKDNSECKVFKETTEGVSPYMNLVYDNSIVNSYSDYNAAALNKILTDNQKKIVESHNSDSDNPLLVIYHLK